MKRSRFIKVISAMLAVVMAVLVLPIGAITAIAKNEDDAPLETMIGTNLGQGFNLLGGNAISNKALAASRIFRKDENSNMGYTASSRAIEETTSSISYITSFDSYVKNESEKFSFSLGTKASMWMVALEMKADYGFESLQSLSGSSSSELLSIEVQRQETSYNLQLDTQKQIQRLWDNELFDEDFVDALLGIDGRSIEDFFEAYGTHMITAYIDGGEMRMVYQGSNLESKSNQTFNENVSTNMGIGAEGFGASVSIEATLSGESKKSEENESGNGVKKVGGTVKGGTGYAALTGIDRSMSWDDGELNKWLDTVSVQPVIVGAEGLKMIAIWELILDDAYLDRRIALEEYFNRNVDLEYAQLYSDYIYSPTERKDFSGCTFIQTAEDLVNIANDLGGDYVLLNNIDLGGIEWSPIGTENAPFTGTIDGNGNTVSGLTITKTTDGVAGLFGCNVGTIKDLRVEGNIDADATGSDNNVAYIGGIAGINKGNIINCYNSVAVNGKISITNEESGENIGTLINETWFDNHADEIEQAKLTAPTILTDGLVVNTFPVKLTGDASNVNICIPAGATTAYIVLENANFTGKIYTEADNPREICIISIGTSNSITGLDDNTAVEIKKSNLYIAGEADLTINGGKGSQDADGTGKAGMYAINSEAIDILCDAAVYLNGGKGGDGANGVAGDHGISHGGICSCLAYDERTNEFGTTLKGADGTDGNPGGDGKDGGKGEQPISNAVLLTAYGNSKVILHSGDGGRGGDGGHGGDGGNGQNGRDGYNTGVSDWDAFWGGLPRWHNGCAGGNAGNGGNGGNGGDGGMGAGKTSSSNIEIEADAMVSIIVGINGNGGNGGAGGNGGKGGDAGKCTDASVERHVYGGHGGNAGNAGKGGDAGDGQVSGVAGIAGVPGEIGKSGAHNCGEYHDRAMPSGNSGTTNSSGENGNIKAVDEAPIIMTESKKNIIYVGGIAGYNSGIIEKTRNDLQLNVNAESESGNITAYAGGIAGVNYGKIDKVIKNKGVSCVVNTNGTASFAISHAEIIATVCGNGEINNYYVYSSTKDLNAVATSPSGLIKIVKTVLDGNQVGDNPDQEIEKFWNNSKLAIDSVSKPDYYVSQIFDKNTIEIKYNGDLLFNYSMFYNFHATGTSTVTIYYTDGDTTYERFVPILVRNKRITDVKIVNMPNKIEFFVDDEFTYEGLKVKALYEDGTENFVSTKYITVSIPSLADEGTKTVNITYTTSDGEQLSTSYDINVSVIKIEKIAIKQLPYKTVYNFGEKISLDGLIVEAIKNNGTKEEIKVTEGMVSYDFSTQGESIVTVRYNEFSATFTCTVKEFDETNAPRITVNSATSVEGGRVEVSVSLANNPGIVSMYLVMQYDTAILELIEVRDSGLLNGKTFGNNLTSPYAVTWDDSTAGQNNTGNGKIVTFIFNVREGAPLGYTPITVSYSVGDIIDYNLNPVAFHIENGYVNVAECMPGDINMDGTVNAVDVASIRRYLAGWDGYDNISLEAADVNNDGSVNATDVALLRRFLAGWDGIELI